MHVSRTDLVDLIAFFLLFLGVVSTDRLREVVEEYEKWRRFKKSLFERYANINIIASLLMTCALFCRICISGALIQMSKQDHGRVSDNTANKFDRRLVGTTSVQGPWSNVRTRIPIRRIWHIHPLRRNRSASFCCRGMCNTVQCPR